MTKKLKVVGIDIGLRNTGFAKATLDLNTMELVIDDLILIQTESSKTKEVRKNSDDMRRAKIIHDAVQLHTKDSSFAIAEIPTGSQVYRAAFGFGICIGVLSGCPIPIIQVQPTEVKLATVGKKNATKDEMIAHAVKTHPEARWLMRKLKGELVLVNDNEHLADAVSVIYAGLLSDQFRQATAILKGMS